MAMHFVTVCEAMQFRPCVGTECDLEAPCERHARTTQIAHRYRRLVEFRRARGHLDPWQLAARRVALHPDETLTQALARHGYTHTRSERYSCRAIMRGGRVVAYQNAFTAWIWLDRRNRKLAAMRSGK